MTDRLDGILQELDIEVEEDLRAEEIEEGDPFSGGYNTGRKVGDFIYWLPIEDYTAEVEDTQDLLSYHASRAVNAEVLSSEGLEVVDYDLVLAGEDTVPLMRTRFRGDLGVGEEEVRNILGWSPQSGRGGNRAERRMQGNDPWKKAVEEVDWLMEDIDRDELISEGMIFYAGDDPGPLDSNPGNWGVNPVSGSYVLLDLGEVPNRENFPSESPYSSGREMWSETGIEERSQQLLDEYGVENSGVEEYLFS
jgi:hypothetical protein